MKRVLYIAAASRVQGIGHLQRSLQIIQILRREKFPVRAFAITGDEKDRMKCTSLLGGYDECVMSPWDIEPLEGSRVVVDVYDDLQGDVLQWLEKRHLYAFALDWYADTDCRVLSMINLRNDPSALKYCIIREEFLQAKKRYENRRSRYDAAVVTGGGDRRGYLPTLIDYFFREKYFSDKNIAVVMGPMTSLRSVDSDSKGAGNIEFFHAPPNLADIMAGSAVGISNGGTTLMEFTMLGVPTLIFPQTEKEDSFVEPFVKNGCGILGLLDSEAFVRQFKDLRENETVRKEMSEKAVGLVDGRGAERVSQAIIKFLEEGV